MAKADHPSAEDEVRALRAFRWLYLALIVAGALSFGVLAVRVFSQQDTLGEQATQIQHAQDRAAVQRHALRRLALRTDRRQTLTNTALCTFRSDLRHRVHQSVRIVRDHPEVIRQFGLTTAQVHSQILNQKATLDSLSTLPC